MPVRSRSPALLVLEPGQVSTLTCWMLMTSWPSYPVNVYQIVTSSVGKCSSYAPGSGSSMGKRSASVGTCSSSKWKIVRWTLHRSGCGRASISCQDVPGNG
jgi:hypothetical protein